VALILILGPLSGAHFKPPSASHLRYGAAPLVGFAGFYIASQGLGRIGVWAAKIMCELPVRQ
jgi:hypothetical protein